MRSVLCLLFVVADAGPAIAAVPSTHVERVLTLVETRYLDKSQIRPYDMLMQGLRAMQTKVGEILIDDFDAPRVVRVTVGARQESFELSSVPSIKTLVKRIDPIWDFVAAQLPTDALRSKAHYALLNGMLSALDPHTSVIEPKNYSEMQLYTSGKFGGLGVVISVRDSKLVVMSPIDGTPASRAGLRAKDHIVRIDDYSTTNMELATATSLMRGDPGQPVDIWVQREGWSKPRRIRIVRQLIKIESITAQLLSDDVGYIRIKSISAGASDQMRDHLRRMRREAGGELRGLVLDLRDNPGGLLNQATKLADRFIARGTLVGGTGSRIQVVEATATATETRYPIVVLANAGTASGAEFLAGALQAHGRALVVGQQTFGKGSVQALYALAGGAALKLTIAEYLVAGKHPVQAVGLTPDIVVSSAVVGRERINLVPDVRLRELNLSGARERTGAAASRLPSFNVVLLADEIDRDRNLNPDAKTDSTVALASRLLVASKGATAKDLLRAAEAVVDTWRQDQDRAIAKAIESLGVDWRAGAAGKSGAMKVTLSVVGKQPVKVGKTVTLKATVKNIGRTALHRVIGSTTADVSIFENLEFPFGRIEPGKSKSWKVDVEVPLFEVLSALRVDLAVTAQHGSAEASASTIVELSAPPRPRFEVKVRWLRAIGRDGVELGVDVHNHGAAAGEVVAILRGTGESPLSIEHGLHKFGAMRSGKRGSGKLSFRVTKDVTQAEVRITALDQKVNEFVEQIVSVPLRARPGHVLATYEAPELEVQPERLVTDEELLRLEGEVRAVGRLADIMVIVNGKKVYYDSLRGIAPRGGRVRFPFDISVTLDEGNNFITVKVRKDEQVWSQRQFRVLRDPTASKLAVRAPAPRPVRRGGGLSLNTPLSMLVLEFKSKGGKLPEQLPAVITTMLLSELDSVDKLKTVGMEDINAMLDVERRKDLLGCDDTACLAEIGGALGADAILHGSIGVLGSRYAVGVSVVDADTAEVKCRVSLLIPSDPDQLADSLPALVERVVEKLNRKR